MEICRSMCTRNGKYVVNEKKPSKFKGLILAMLSGIIYSLISVIVKDMKNLHPGQLAFYRFVSIFITCLPQTVQVGQNPLGPKKFRTFIILRGIFGGVNIFLSFLAIRYLSLGEAIAIIYSVPVFVTLAARIFLKEPCSAFQSFTVVLTVIGIIFISKLPSQLTKEPVVYTKEKLGGLLAGMFSLVFTSSQALLVRKMTCVHPAIMNFNYGWVASTEVLILTVIFGNFSWHQCGNQAAYIIVFGLFSYVGQLMMVIALQCELAGPVTTIKSSSDIILAFFWQILIFHDNPDSYSIIGATLVGLSVIFTGLNKLSFTRSSGSDSKDDEISQQN